MHAVLLILIAILSSGCARPNGQGEAGEGDASAPPPLAASVDVQVTDGGVRLSLHITNTTSRPIEFSFPTSQRYDFVVARPSGEVVWRWSEGMAFLQVLSQATLAPGESWDMEAVWEPGSVTGELVATARLTAAERPVEQRTTFELP